MSVVCSGAEQIRRKRTAGSSASVENLENSELRRIFCLPSHSGHRAVVHRSRSSARLTLRPFVPKSTAETGVLIGPGRRWPGLPFFGRVMAMTVRIIPILAVAITIGPSLAYGSPACMTESEARAKFPKAHLYMHGNEHCWNDSAADSFRALSAAPVHSPRQPSRAAVPALFPRPALAAASVPSPRPEIVNSGIDAGAQCQYSPCE